MRVHFVFPYWVVSVEVAQANEMVSVAGVDCVGVGFKEVA